jgi:hypothetical protein
LTVFFNFFFTQRYGPFMTEDRRQKTEDRGQMTDDKGQKTEDSESVNQ